MGDADAAGSGQGAEDPRVEAMDWDAGTLRVVGGRTFRGLYPDGSVVHRRALAELPPKAREAWGALDNGGARGVDYAAGRVYLRNPAVPEVRVERCANNPDAWRVDRPDGSVLYGYLRRRGDAYVLEDRGPSLTDANVRDLERLWYGTLSWAACPGDPPAPTPAPAAPRVQLSADRMRATHVYAVGGVTGYQLAWRGDAADVHALEGDRVANLVGRVTPAGCEHAPLCSAASNFGKDLLLIQAACFPPPPDSAPPPRAAAEELRPSVVERIDWAARTATVDGVAYTLYRREDPDGWRARYARPRVGYATDLAGDILGADARPLHADDGETFALRALQAAWFAPGSTLAGGSVEAVDYVRRTARAGGKEYRLERDCYGDWQLHDESGPLRAYLTVEDDGLHGDIHSYSEHEPLARDLCGVWGVVPAHCRPPAADEPEVAHVRSDGRVSCGESWYAVTPRADGWAVHRGDPRLGQRLGLVKADGTTCLLDMCVEENRGMDGCRDQVHALRRLRAVVDAWRHHQALPLAPLTGSPPSPEVSAAKLPEPATEVPRESEVVISADRTTATTGGMTFRLFETGGLVEVRTAQDGPVVPRYTGRFATGPLGGAVTPSLPQYARTLERVAAAYRALPPPAAAGVASRPDPKDLAAGGDLRSAPSLAPVVSPEEARRIAKDLWVAEHGYEHWEECTRHLCEDGCHPDCANDYCEGGEDAACWRDHPCDCGLAGRRAELTKLCAALGVEVPGATEEPEEEARMGEAVLYDDADQPMDRVRYEGCAYALWWRGRVALVRPLGVSMTTLPVGVVGRDGSYSVSDGHAEPSAATRVLQAVAAAVAKRTKEESVATKTDVKDEEYRGEAPSTLEQLGHDAAEAAWRTAGSQYVKAVKEPLVALIARHLGPDDPSLRARIAGFVDSPVGEALLAALLSAGLGLVPGMGGVPAKMSRELRVRAMAGGADLALDVLAAPLREVLALYLRDVPEVAGVLPDGAHIAVTPIREGVAVGAEKHKP